MPEPEKIQARTRFVQAKVITRGTITDVEIQQDPFHCVIKILPKNPELISVEGRYSSNQLSLGKLKRNLIHLKFQIDTLDDIIPALESLENRQCDFRIDKSGWLEWIEGVFTSIPVEMDVKVPKQPPSEDIDECYFIRVPGSKCIYTMENQRGEVLGYAVGPTGTGTASPHGWILYLDSIDEAKEILNKRKKI